MNNFKRLLPTIILILIEVVIGIMLLVNGEKLTGVIFITFGILMLVAGIINLIMSLLDAKRNGVLQTLPLIMSVILIAVGGFFAAASGSVTEVVSTFTMIYGIIMTINGVIKLSDYLAFRTFTDYRNGFMVFNAILSIVLGFIISFNPFGATLAIWTITGIALLVTAALDIVALINYSIVLRKRADEGK